MTIPEFSANNFSGFYTLEATMISSSLMLFSTDQLPRMASISLGVFIL